MLLLSIIIMFYWESYKSLSPGNATTTLDLCPSFVQQGIRPTVRSLWPEIYSEKKVRKAGPAHAAEMCPGMNGLRALALLKKGLPS